MRDNSTAFQRRDRNEGGSSPEGPADAHYVSRPFGPNAVRSSGSTRGSKFTPGPVRESAMPMGDGASSALDIYRQIACGAALRCLPTSFPSVRLSLCSPLTLRPPVKIFTVE